MKESIRPPCRPSTLAMRAGRVCAVLPALLVALATACAAPSGEGNAAPGASSGPLARQSEAVTTSSSLVSYGGGSVISNVHVVPVFWTPYVDPTLKSEVQCYFDAVVRSPYIDWLSEYDTPTQTIGRGSASAPVTIYAPWHTSTYLSDDDMQSELAKDIDLSWLPPPDNDTLYMVYLPAGYDITLPHFLYDQHSCVLDSSSNGFCGYHKSFAHDGQLVRYGVILDQTPGGPCQCASGSTDFTRMSTSSSHELMEAVTDPDPSSGWYGNSAEIADLCPGKGVALPGTFYSVQPLWSNARGLCFAPTTGPAQVDAPVLDLATSSTMAGPYATSTQVTLDGSCFANPTGVVKENFSSSPLGIASTSSFDHLDITVPPSPIGLPGDATLYIANQGGPLASTPFTYTSPITPTLSPGDGPMQGGTAVTISGGPFPTALGTTVGVTFGGVPAASVQCTSTYTCVAYPAAHDPGTVPVTIDINGVVQTARNEYTFDGPQIVGTQPSHGPMTGGTAVTVTGIDMAYLSQTAWLAPATFGGASVQAECVREGMYSASCTMTAPPVTVLPTTPVDIRIGITTAAGTAIQTTVASADQFTYDPLPALGGITFSGSYATVTGSVALDGYAPSGGSVVSLALAAGAPKGVVQVPSTVTVPGGSMVVSFPVTVLDAAYTGDVSIVATYDATVATGTITAGMIQATAVPPLAFTSSTDLPFTTGMTSPVAVTLGKPAPAGGAVVSLVSSRPAYLVVPASVTVPPGATSATFTMTSEYYGAPVTVTVTGTYAGATASLGVGVGYLPHLGGSSGGTCGTRCQ